MNANGYQREKRTTPGRICPPSPSGHKHGWARWKVALASLIFLALLGAIAARTGGAPLLKGALRVTFWGAMAMLLTATVGRLFGVVA